MPWLSWLQLLSQNLEQCLEQNNSNFFEFIFLKKKNHELGIIVTILQQIK